MNKILYVNEAEYHQCFIDNTNDFPNELKSEDNDMVLAWAHELRLYDAGVNGGDGFADILTVDESGFVWLIEAKMHSSQELNGNIWKYQIERYQKALCEMPWNSIHRYIKSYILGKEQTKPFPNIFQTANDLTEVIITWQRFLDRKKISPATMVDRIHTHLKSGTYGIAILAETDEIRVIKSSKYFEHKGPLAYIRSVPNGNKLFTKCTWLDKRISNFNVNSELLTSSHYKFAEYEKKKKKIEGKIEVFLDGLCDSARDLFINEVIPAMIDLGWDEKDVSSNSKSMMASFPVGKKKIPLVQFGWSDTDAGSITREYKNIGSASFKLDFNLWKCKNEPFSTKNNIEKWAKYMAEIGWEGKGSGKSAGKRPLTTKEYEKWGRTMVYKKTEKERDFIGRSSDYKIIRDFYKNIKLIINEIQNFSSL